MNFRKKSSQLIVLFSHILNVQLENIIESEGGPILFVISISFCLTSSFLSQTARFGTDFSMAAIFSSFSVSSSTPFTGADADVAIPASCLMRFSGGGSSTADGFLITSAHGILYFRTAFSLLWPVLDIISCSSTPAWYKAVAHVRFPEWLEYFPSSPAFFAIVSMKFLILLIPTGCSPYLKVAPPCAANGFL